MSPNAYTLCKTAVRRAFRLVGLDVRRSDPPWARDRSEADVPPVVVAGGRATLRASLELAARNGLKPATVIDCGAAFGTEELYACFPEAHHVLVEPIEEYRSALERLVGGLKSGDLVMAAAAARSGLSRIHVHPDLVGTSLYREEEDSDVNGVVREVPTVTLDQLCHERGLRGPYLIKLDVQGAELDVLRGASSVLGETDLIVLEASFFEFYKGAPQVPEVMAFMSARGFVPYDLVGLQYRLLDGAMSQADIVFVRDAGPLRVDHSYANAEQRREQNEAFREVVDRLQGGGGREREAAL